MDTTTLIRKAKAELMATYQITSRPDESGFDVEIKEASGAHHRWIAFATRADAEVWILIDQKLALEQRCG